MLDFSGAMQRWPISKRVVFLTVAVGWKTHTPNMHSLMISAHDSLHYPHTFVNSSFSWLSISSGSSAWSWSTLSKDADASNTLRISLAVSSKICEKQEWCQKGKKNAMSVRTRPRKARKSAPYFDSLRNGRSFFKANRSFGNRVLHVSRKCTTCLFVSFFYQFWEDICYG